MIIYTIDTLFPGVGIDPALVNGQEGEEEAAEAVEAEGGGERNGEAIVKELSEAGPPSVNGDEGYAEDEVDNVESEDLKDGEQDTGAAVFRLLSNLL